MDDEGALLDTIAASPDDDLPRLVYADWQEEHGDGPRAEFVRAHVELARTSRSKPEFERLADAARVLLRVHGGEWLAAFAPFGSAVRWTVDWGVPGRYTGNRGEEVDRRMAELDCTLGAADAALFRLATIDRGLVGKVQSCNLAVDLGRHPVRHLEVGLSPDDPAGFAPDQPALGRVDTLGLVCQGTPAPDAATGRSKVCS